MHELDAFEQDVLSNLKLTDRPTFRAGDTLKVSIKITEGNKERYQDFEGVCIARKNRGLHSSFRVRKILAGEGVERQFPLYSPLIKIERVRQGVVRRAKLYYLRDRRGKSARIKEKYVAVKKEKNVAKQAAAPKVQEQAKSSAVRTEQTPETKN